VTRWDWINRVTSPGGPESTTVRYALVVLVLHFYNEEEGRAWPKVETLMERTGHKSIRTLQEALGEAEATGWLRRDAKPGRVTYYHPAIPEDRMLRLDPANYAGSTPQRLRATPQKTAGDPANSADDLRKDLRKDSQKEEAATCPFSCPVCHGPMERIAPKRKKGPDFFGCVAYRRTGCPGKRELDGTDSTPKGAKSEAPNLAKITEAKRAELRDVRKTVAEEAQQPSELDDKDRVARLLAAVRKGPTPARGGPPQRIDVRQIIA
jgi:hypothetical protein